MRENRVQPRQALRSLVVREQATLVELSQSREERGRCTVRRRGTARAARERQRRFVNRESSELIHRVSVARRFKHFPSNLSPLFVFFDYGPIALGAVARIAGRLKQRFRAALAYTRRYF